MSASSQPDEPAGDRDQDHPQREKASRVFACVSCQRRKVKCDRHTPCYNCIKVGIPTQPPELPLMSAFKGQDHLRAL